MTVRRAKKVLSYRGTKWHGGGSKKKRRGKGSRGGKGMAGIWKHKKVWLRVHHPEYFDKYKLKSDSKVRTINLKDLEAMSLKIGKNEINLEEAGYGKLLGTGNISTAIKVKIPSASKSAIEKIENAGGSVELS